MLGSWGHVRAMLGPCWPCWDHVGAKPWPYWGHVGAMLSLRATCSFWVMTSPKRNTPVLGHVGGHVGPCWGHVGHVGAMLGPNLGHAGVMLSLCSAKNSVFLLGHDQPQKEHASFGSCWACVGPGGSAQFPLKGVLSVK